MFLTEGVRVAVENHVSLCRTCNSFARENHYRFIVNDISLKRIKKVQKISLAS